MMKKIVYAGIAIAITIGAAYSYERVRFDERTVVFFKRALGGESDQRFARGRGGFEGRREFSNDSARAQFNRDGARGDRSARPESERDQLPGTLRGARDTSGFPNDIREQFEQDPEEMQQRVQQFSQARGAGNSRSGRESRGRGGGHGRGSNISLREVAYYTLILSFAAMATFWLDQLARITTRARHMSKSR
jgi:hypothetical protein